MVKTKKPDFVSLINEIENITSDDFKDELNNLKQKAKNNTLSLAVLGQFKRGKTFLLNALIGEPILPTAIVPLTSIITVLKYNHKKSAKVLFSNKKEKDILLSEIELYATEKGNPNNKKGVAVVEVHYPSAYLKKGILLIDTPGTGSTFLHNSEITYDYLKNIDAGIFLLTADQPVSQSEIGFLKEIKNHTDRIFFVLNKIDYLSEEEKKEIISFNKKALEKELGENIDIFSLSSKWAIEAKKGRNKNLLKKSGMILFENELNKFFSTKKDETLSSSIRGKLLNLTTNMTGYFELEKQAIKTPIRELEQKLKQFKESTDIMKGELEDAEPIIKAEINKIMEFVDDDFSEFKKESEKPVLEKLEKRYSELAKLSKEELVDQIIKYYAELMEEIFEPVRLKEEDKVREHYEKITRRFSEKTENIIEDIGNLSSELFKVSIPYTKTKDKFTLQKGPDYRVDPLFYSLSDQIIYLLPKFAFKKIVWKNISDSVKEHIDMNCGRIRSDFLFRLNEDSIKFIDTLNERVESTLNYLQSAIEKGMNENRKTSKEINAKITEIDSNISRLKIISKQLR